MMSRSMKKRTMPCSAIDANDLEAIVDAITEHGEYGMPELVAEARAAREKMKKSKKKALKQDKARAEKLARAESAAPELMHRLSHEEDVGRLQEAVSEAEEYAGLLSGLDSELQEAQKRILELRAAAKAVTIEEHTDEYVDRIAIATERMSVADSKPSAAAAAASPPTEPPAAIDSRSECVVCMNAPASHALAPCGHQCVCEACINVGEECPMCRVTVTLKMKIFKT